MAGAADLTVCEASIYARTLSCQVTCARRPVVTDRAARGVHSIAYSSSGSKAMPRVSVLTGLAARSVTSSAKFVRTA